MIPALVAPAAAVVMASPAQADQYDFVAALDNNGVYYPSIVEVIDTGKQVCKIVRTYGTPQSVDIAVTLLDREGYGSGAEKGVIIAAATKSMCPDITPQVAAYAQWAATTSTSRV